MKKTDSKRLDKVGQFFEYSLPPRDCRWLRSIVLVLVLLQIFVYTWGGGGLYLIVWLPTVSLILFMVATLFFRLVLFPYDRILSASSSDGLNWQKEPGIRIDVGGVHRSRQVYSPCVIRVGTEWHMFYRGGGYNSVIVKAVSSDGLIWHEEGEECIGLGGGYETVRVDFPTVAKWAGRWRMWYGATDGRCWRIFSRDSDDLVEWRNEQVAIDMGDHDRITNAIDPTIIKDSGGWRLLFTAFGDAENHFYTAYSTDGIKWLEPVECRGFEPEKKNLRNANVIRLANGKMRMYFSEYTTSIIGSNITSAISGDGIVWQREDGMRLTVGTDYDKHGVFCPNIIEIEGGLRMYYGGYWGKHWCEWLTLLRHRRI